MKFYVCKKCGFSGIRKSVRAHLREEHLVRGLQHDKITGEREESQLTKNTIAEEIN